MGSAPDAFRLRLRRAAQTSLVLLVAIVATGCTKLVYNRLDTLAGWYLGSLVSLERQQRQDLRSWLTRTLEWHRTSELGRYAGFLRELSSRAAAPGGRAVYDSIEQQVEAFGQAVVARAAPEAARLLLTLSPAQLDELDRNLEERSVERAEEDQEAIEKGKWRRDRARDWRRQLKRWTGDVTKEQEQLIDEAIGGFEPTSAAWLESQRQWRGLLIETLRSGAAAHVDTEQRILQLLIEPNLHWTADYIARSERNREQSLALLESLDASLTQSQRERLQRELLQLADMLDALQPS